MDTLSLVSKYLNDLEEYLDDGDSLEVKKFTVGKSKEELEMFKALEHKSVVVEVEKRRVVVFAKATSYAYSKPFTRFSLPCDVDGQGAWDAELDMADSFNYMTEERFDKLGFVRLDYGDYGRKMVKYVCVEIHGFTFLVDFVVIGYANEGEPSVLFGRDFLVTLKSKVDFGVGEMRIDLTMLEEERDMDALLMELVENMEETGSLNGELIKMGKAAATRLEESKPILEVLENYMTYRKKLDEVMTGRARLSSDEFGEEEKMRIVEHELPKKMCDPGNFVLPVQVNGTIEMSALADTRASVSVLPYSLFKNLGLSDPRPYNSTLTMADKTQAKAMGEGYLENFEIDKEDDWLSCFEVGRDKDGNPKYGPVAPSFLDIEDDMDRSVAMEAYFNPFKNIIVFKKLIDFLGSLPVQLKNNYWGNEGYEVYKKIEGDRAWHAKFEVITPSGQKFTRGFNPKETKRKLSGKFTSEDILKLCEHEQVLTLPQFVVLLGLYEESELEHRLFAIQFTRLEIDDKLFNHDAYWQRIGMPTRTNKRKSLIKEPHMRIVHRLIVGSLVHRLGSKERCQKRDLWMMSALEESRGINLAWVIAEHLCKHALGLKENSLICGGHYVTEIAKSWGYLLDEEVAKCSEPIECEKWTSKMLAR
ncbi:hypothetical protein Tco_1361666 [Tanacetum coccineum]